MIDESADDDELMARMIGTLWKWNPRKNDGSWSASFSSGSKGGLDLAEHNVITVVGVNRNEGGGFGDPYVVTCYVDMSFIEIAIGYFDTRDIGIYRTYHEPWCRLTLLADVP